MSKDVSRRDFLKGAALSALGLGLMGVWMAYGLDVITRGLLLWRRYRRGAWMMISI